MSHIEVFYKGNQSTLSVHKESGSEVRTDMLKFSPTDLLAASLASCVMTIMSLVAEKLNVDFSGAKAEVVKEMTKALPRKVHSLLVKFSCPVNLPEETRVKLEKAAKDCPVHHSLSSDVKIEYHFQWGTP